MAGVASDGDANARQRACVTYGNKVLFLRRGLGTNVSMGSSQGNIMWELINASDAGRRTCAVFARA